MSSKKQSIGQRLQKAVWQVTPKQWMRDSHNQLITNLQSPHEASLRPRDDCVELVKMQRSPRAAAGPRTGLNAPKAPEGAQKSRAAKLSELPNIGDTVEQCPRAAAARQPAAWQPEPRLGQSYQPTGQVRVVESIDQHYLARPDRHDDPGTSASYVLGDGQCAGLSSLWLHSKALGHEAVFHQRLTRIADGSATHGDFEKLANALAWLHFSAPHCQLLQGNRVSPLDLAIGVRRVSSRVAQHDSASLGCWLVGSLLRGQLAFVTAHRHACGVYLDLDGIWWIYDPNQFGEASALDALTLQPLFARAFTLGTPTLTLVNIYCLDADMAVAQRVHGLPYSAETQTWEHDVPCTLDAWYMALSFHNPDAIARLQQAMPKHLFDDALGECAIARNEAATLSLLAVMSSQEVKPSAQGLAAALCFWPERWQLFPFPQDLDAIVSGQRFNLLTLAAELGELDVLQSLIQAGADPNAIAGPMTPLGAAANRGDLHSIRLLLDAGASPNAHALTAASPLMFASRRGHVAVLEALLRAGARVDYEVTGFKAADVTRERRILRHLGGAAPSWHRYVHCRSTLGLREENHAESDLWYRVRNRQEKPRRSWLPWKTLL